MNTLAHDIATFLDGSGVGQFPWRDAAWAVSVGSEPSTPSQSVTIYDTGGAGPDTKDDNVFRPNFQVRARSLDYALNNTKLSEVRELLTHNSLILTTSFAVIIKAVSDVMSMGKTEDNHWIMVQNYSAVRIGIVEEYDNDPEDWSDVADDIVDVPT